MMRVKDLDSYDVKGNTVDTRIEIVSCRDSEDILIRQYKDRGYTVLGVDRVYEDEDTTILRPIEVLRRFKTLKKTGQVVIVGLSYYLRLWNQTNTNDFFGAFRDLLDSQRSGLILIIQRDVFSDSVFSNPRYQNSIVFLQSAKEIESTEFSESVAVLDADSAPASLVVGSYKELVHRMCNPLRNDRHIYAIRNRGTRSIGFTNVVLWPDDPSKILDLIWDYKENLPTDTSSSLLKCCVDGDISPVRYIDKLFGKENLDKVHVLNRICELSDEAVFSAILVYLKRRFAADSYIGKALESYSGRDSFQHHYIVTAAIENIGDVHQKSMANERKAAIKQCTVGSEESMISEFVSKVKYYPEATCWLNCGTDSERCDLIRRAGTYNLFGTFPEEISDLYPFLKDYIGLDYDYGNSELTEYFRQYRVNKIMNQIPQGFLDLVNHTKAKSIDVPPRRQALSEYKSDYDTAVLLVDGMGAEYLPLLVSLFKKEGLNIEFANTVKAELPTITELNPVEWENKLRDIKGIDNTAHDGAEKHVVTELEENIYATFQVIEKDVVKSVVKGVSEYKRVIITADHGLTRLAVLANDLSKSNTLDYEGDGWRYMKLGDTDTVRPENVDVEHNDQNGEYYWTIRNYDRFRKKGGVKYEMHGGSSVEEMMVPFIVVTRDGTDIVVPAKRKNERISGSFSYQMKENEELNEALDELFG